MRLFPFPFSNNVLFIFLIPRVLMFLIMSKWREYSLIIRIWCGLLLGFESASRAMVPVSITNECPSCLHVKNCICLQAASHLWVVCAVFDLWQLFCCWHCMSAPQLSPRCISLCADCLIPSKINYDSEDTAQHHDLVQEGRCFNCRRSLHQALIHHINSRNYVNGVS